LYSIILFEKNWRILIENIELKIFSNNNFIYDIFLFSISFKKLFNDVIEYENKLNNIKRMYITLRLRLKELFSLIDIVLKMDLILII